MFFVTNGVIGANATIGGTIVSNGAFGRPNGANGIINTAYLTF